MRTATNAGRRLSLVVFLLERRRHALALDGVDRVLRMVSVSPLPEAPPIVLGVVNVRGAIVPVLDLRARFAFAARPYGPEAHLLLVRTGRRRLLLAVDAVVGVEIVPLERVIPPDPVMPGTRRLAGVVTLPDGLVFIHDLEALLSLDEEQGLDHALEGGER